MGGARPKLTVEHDGRLWLAKFPSSRDDQSLPDAKLEAAMLALGVLCGINTANAQVVLGDVLLVERFDRAWVDGPEPGWRRDSFLSARTIFNASARDQTYAAGGYGRLATELVRYSADPQSDQKALFRRMVFNVCISNTDDHDRNHGVLADDQPGFYRLSPAYDLLPRQHSTLRTRENLLADGAKFGLSPTEAEVIVKEVELGVALHWHDCLSAQGLSASAIDRLKSCFGGIPLTAKDVGQAIESRRNPR
jgi:serine/threonine-protein kinase HipA